MAKIHFVSPWDFQDPLAAAVREFGKDSIQTHGFDNNSGGWAELGQLFSQPNIGDIVLIDITDYGFDLTEHPPARKFLEAGTFASGAYVFVVLEIPGDKRILYYYPNGSREFVEMQIHRFEDISGDYAWTPMILRIIELNTGTPLATSLSKLLRD